MQLEIELCIKVVHSWQPLLKDQHEQASACWPASFENTEVCNEDVEFMTVRDDGRFARLDDMDFIELPMKSSEARFEI